MDRFEYLEVDLHGDPGSRNGEPSAVSPPPGDGQPLGEGKRGYIAKLDEYGKQGWEMIWMDRDSTARIIAILKRTKSDAPPAPDVSPAAARASLNRDMAHG